VKMRKARVITIAKDDSFQPTDISVSQRASDALESDHTVGPLTSMSLTTEPLRRPPPQLPQPRPPLPRQPRKLPRKGTTFARPLRILWATSGPGFHFAGTVATQIAPLQGAFNSLRLEKPLVCEDASWQIALLYSDLVYMTKSRPYGKYPPRSLNRTSYLNGFDRDACQIFAGPLWSGPGPTRIHWSWMDSRIDCSERNGPVNGHSFRLWHLKWGS